MYHLSLIHNFEIIDKVQSLIEQRYADKVKIGIDYFAFNCSSIKIYLSEKKVIAYAANDLKSDEHQKLKHQLFIKYQRNVEIKKTIMGYVVPEGFILDGRGITAIKETTTKDGDIKTQYLLISNRWLFVDSKIYSQYHSVFQYEVRSYDPKSKKSKTELCISDYLGKWAYCLSFLMNSLAVVTEEAYKKELTTYFNKFVLENYKNMKTKITMPHMGWDKNLTEFFPYSEKLHFDFTGDTSKYLKNTIKGFKPTGNKNKFIEKLNEITKNKDADFIISTAFAAPLIQIIGIRSFVINFFGTSGNMKSLASKFAIACFGDPARLCSAGNHTKNVLIEKLSKFHNLPFYVDEITEDSMDVYSVGNETGRHRLNRAGQMLEAITWRTIMFCTSEASVARDSNKAGEINRLLCIPVDCTPEKLILPGAGANENLNKEEFARNLYLFIETNHGLLGEDYIKYIINQKEQIKNDYKTIVDNIFDPKKQKQHVYMISSSCLGNYIYRKLFLGIDDLNYSINLGTNFIKRIAQKEDLDPIIKMYETINEFYEINQSAFKIGNLPQKTNYCYGAIKGNEIYFILNPLKEYLTKNGFNWNDKKSLIDRGLIEYKAARIGTDVGKRIILNLKKNINEEVNYSIIERAGMQEDNIIDFPRNE